MKGMTRSGNIILTIIFSLALGSLSGCTDPLGQNIYAANIGVLLGTDSVQPGGSYNLGDVTINQATEITITIRNTGNEVLELGGTDAIVFSGEYASFFSLQDAPSAAVGAGEEVTGTLVCLPTAAVGDFSVEAMIASNAGNEEELTLTLTGKAVNEDGVVDTTSPTVTVTSVAGGITDEEDIPFTVSFSEPVFGFTEDDLDITVDTGTYTVSGFSANAEGDEYILQVTLDTEPAEVTVEVSAGVAADAVGNENTASASACVVVYDTSVLTVETLSIEGPGTITNQSPLDVTIKFSEEVEGFTTGDVELGNNWFISLNGFSDSSNPIFSVTIEKGDEGDVTISVPEGGATSLTSGRANAASSITFTYDETAPAPPDVAGDATPTKKHRPQWTWTPEGGGNGTYRYRLDDDDLTEEPETEVTSHTPESELPNGEYTLFVQERDDAGNWSECGEYTIIVESYTVTYDGRGHDGGTVPTDTVYYAPGEEVVVQSGDDLYQDDINDRYFVYWNTKSDGSGTYYVPSGEPDYAGSFNMGNSDVILYAIYIGDPGPAGGWIYYDDQDTGSVDIADARFLEAAYEDLSPSVEWGGFGSDINTSNPELPPELTGIGDGYANTEKIVEELGDNDDNAYSAQECWNLGPPVTPNWFLPSKDELQQMYENLFKNGIGGFDNVGYFSSSEIDDQSLRGLSFNGGAWYGYQKYNSIRTRASRAF